MTWKEAKAEAQRMADTTDEPWVVCVADVPRPSVYWVEDALHTNKRVIWTAFPE